MNFLLNHSLEENILAACVKKERWAQKVLYEHYYASMIVVCKRYANNDNDALDILHDGFIKIFKNIGKYKPETSFNAWINRVMINTAIDYYRKQIRRRTENLDNIVEISDNSPDIVNLLKAEDILNCLQALSPTYRTVFNLYVLEEYSHKEIAKTLNIAESTSRSNLVKARHKLRELLQVIGYTNEE